MVKFRLFSASLAMMGTMAAWAGPIEDLVGATYDNPLDATQYIVNADCAAHDGWTELPSAWGSQPAGGSHYEDGDSSLDGFIERWVRGPGKLGNGSMSQVLKDMPKGAYSLTIDAIATQQSNQNITNTGAFVYAEHDGTTTQVEVSTLSGKPQKITVTFYVENDGDITIGFKTVNTTCNWTAVDNYTLKYYGETTKLLKESLSNKLQEVKNVTGGSDAYYTGLQTELANEEEKVNSLASSETATLEELNAEFKALDDLKARIVENMAAYAKFSANVDLASTIIEGGEEGYPDEGIEYLSTFIEDNAIADVWEGHTLGTEDVLKLNDDLVNAIWKGRYYMVGVGDKVTINNPTFSKEDGTDDASGWSGTGPSVQAGVGEKYNGTFDTYQELKGLKNGKYTLKLNAFFRTNNSLKADTTFAQGTAPEVRAVAYINSIGNAVPNIMSDPAEESELSTTDGCYTTQDGKYVPNNRTATNVFFNELGKYQTEVSGIVTDGVLRFGIKLSDASGYDAYWCCYDNFELTYVSDNIADMQDIRDKVVAQAEPLLTGKVMSAAALTGLQTAVNAVKTATTFEDLGAAISDVQAKITAANASINTYATLVKALEASKERVEANKTIAGAYKTNYDRVESNITNGTYADEEIPAAIAEISKFTTTYLMEGVAGTEASPAEVTFVIANADFGTANNTETNKKGNSDGWDKTQNGGSNAVNFNCLEFFNNNSFKLSQKIYGLPAGKYTLKAQAFYRPGDNTAMLTEANIAKANVKLFAGETESDVQLLISEALDATPDAGGSFVALAEGTDYAGKYVPNDMLAASVVFDELGEKHFVNNEVAFEVTGNEEYVEIGAKKDVRIDKDWTIFRRFTLSYVGGDPTGIHAVNGKDAVGVKSVEYYSADGKRLSSPSEGGITIVKKVMADGTVKVDKVMGK